MRRVAVLAASSAVIGAALFAGSGTAAAATLSTPGTPPSLHGLAKQGGGSGSGCDGTSTGPSGSTSSGSTSGGSASGGSGSSSSGMSGTDCTLLNLFGQSSGSGSGATSSGGGTGATSSGTSGGTSSSGTSSGSTAGGSTEGGLISTILNFIAGILGAIGL